MKNRIFSIKNEQSADNKIHKIIYILGLKFSFRNKKKERIYENSLIKNILTDLSQQNEQLRNELIMSKQQIETELTYIKDWQVNFNRNIPEKFPVRLTDLEKLLLLKYLTPASNYLEFGSGGSTFLSLIHSQAKVYSIESDYDWMEYLRTYKLINTAEEKQKLCFKHVDIGQTGAWGMPINDLKMENYPLYSTEIFKDIDGQHVDLIFIDGRFRVACAIATVLNCNKNAYILMHDYTIREQYHVIEEFLDIIEIKDTLAVFKVKENVSVERLNELYNEYKFVKD